MPAPKLNSAHNSGLTFSGMPDDNTSRKRIILVIDYLKNSILYRGKENILARAELSWDLLSAEEKHEYSRRTYSLPINAFDLFMYDYICLSGSELEGSMKALCHNLVNRH